MEAQAEQAIADQISVTKGVDGGLAALHMEKTRVFTNKRFTLRGNIRFDKASMFNLLCNEKADINVNYCTEPDSLLMQST